MLGRRPGAYGRSYTSFRDEAPRTRARLHTALRAPLAFSPHRDRRNRTSPGADPGPILSGNGFAAAYTKTGLVPGHEGIPTDHPVYISESRHGRTFSHSCKHIARPVRSAAHAGTQYRSLLGGFRFVFAMCFRRFLVIVCRRKNATGCEGPRELFNHFTECFFRRGFGRRAGFGVPGGVYSVSGSEGIACLQLCRPPSITIP